MTRGKIEERAATQGIDVLQTPIKSVVIKGVTGSAKEALANPGQYNAFFGISVGAQISDADLEIYMRWVLDNFRHTMFFVDDWEHRWDNMILGNLSMEKATEKALQLGEEWARRLKKVRIDITYKDKDNARSNRIRINRSSEGHNLGSYLKILSNLTETFETDTDFRKDIEDQMNESIGSRIEAWKSRVTKKEDIESGKRLLPNYLLEEVAFTIELVQLQYPIEIYRGLPINVVSKLFDPNEKRYQQLRQKTGFPGEYGHINVGIENINPRNKQVPPS